MGSQSELLSKTYAPAYPPIAVTVINFLCISLAILGIISANIAGGVFVSFVLFSTIFSKGITKLQTTYGEKLQVLFDIR